jgi:hypothetical protein
MCNMSSMERNGVMPQNQDLDGVLANWLKTSVQSGLVDCWI